MPKDYTVGVKQLSDPLDFFSLLEWDEWICPTCKVGFYWETIVDNVGGCTGSCTSFDEQCADCSVEDVCEKCIEGYML